MAHAVHGALEFLHWAGLRSGPASLGASWIIGLTKADDALVPGMLDKPAVEETRKQLCCTGIAGRETLGCKDGRVMLASIVGLDAPWLTCLEIRYNRGFGRLQVAQHQHGPSVRRQGASERVGQATLQGPMLDRKGDGLHTWVDVDVGGDQFRVAQRQGVVEAQIDWNSCGWIGELDDGNFGSPDGLNVAVILSLQHVRQVLEHALRLPEVLYHQAEIHVATPQDQSGFSRTERVQGGPSNVALKHPFEVLDDAPALLSFNL